MLSKSNKIIQYLVNGKSDNEVCDTISFEFMKRNLIIKRIDCQNLTNDSKFLNYTNIYSERILKQEQFIQKISVYLRQCKIKHYFPKAYQHYPDMGNDIDLFILASKKQKLDFINFFKLKKDTSSLLNKLAGKSPYIYQESIPIEIHHYVGHFGEFKKLTESFYTSLVISDYKVRELSNENKILNQIIQRFYGHFTIRLSDIIYTINILNKELNYDLLLKKSKEYGILDALEEYLNFILNNYSNLIENKNIVKYKKIESSEFIYEGEKIFHIKKTYAAKLYLLKFMSDIKNLRFFSVFKILLSPIIFLTIITRNLIK